MESGNGHRGEEWGLVPGTVVEKVQGGAGCLCLWGVVCLFPCFGPIGEVSTLSENGSLHVPAPAVDSLQGARPVKATPLSWSLALL